MASFLSLKVIEEEKKKSYYQLEFLLDVFICGWCFAGVLDVPFLLTFDALKLLNTWKVKVTAQGLQLSTFWLLSSLAWNLYWFCLRWNDVQDRENVRCFCFICPYLYTWEHARQSLRYSGILYRLLIFLFSSTCILGGPLVPYVLGLSIWQHLFASHIEQLIQNHQPSETLWTYTNRGANRPSVTGRRPRANIKFIFFFPFPF